MKIKRFVVLCVGLSILVLHGYAHSCVGRVLTIAVTHSPDQMIMGNMLSLLINERTGTTVELLETESLKASQETVLGEKANIFINYIGFGLQAAGNVGELGDPQKGYTLVRQHYLDTLQMVWLKPFGYDGPVFMETPAKAELTSMAAPVTTKEVLRKFPVLDRVINKLAGMVNNAVLADLANKSKTQAVEEIAREFLKSQKLI